MNFSNLWLSRSFIAFFFALTLVPAPCGGAAADSLAFLKEFVDNYEAHAFERQTTLVKTNRALIPGAVEILTTQALQEDLEFEDKVRLLNIASAMAYMNLHWHEDDSLLKKVEPLISAELKKEEARVAALMKWKNEERIVGNFVMKKHEREMEQQNLPMVLYPHWLHRIMYECKACHDSVFKMKRWENNLSQKDIAEGRQCGTCHNGKTAFNATDDKNCKRCHIVGLPEAERLHKPASVDQDWVKKIAERVGAAWRPENLPNGALPLDRFRFVDWLELKKRNAFEPISSLEQTSKEETRSNRIVFKSQSDFVNDVVFDHKVHSDWINCSTCHPAIFTPELGGNNIKMTAISKGQFCGHCHGKVAFTFADCVRCHKKPETNVVNGGKPDSELLFRSGKNVRYTAGAH